MWVYFEKGYRGVLTNEEYYPPDSKANLKKEIAEKLIAAGRAISCDKKGEPAEDA